jgi:hypothetical protein
LADADQTDDLLHGLFERTAEVDDRPDSLLEHVGAKDSPHLPLERAEGG